MSNKPDLSGKKPTLADRFDAADRNVRVSNPDAKQKPRPEWDLSIRPTGGLKPDGARAKAELNF